MCLKWWTLFEMWGMGSSSHTCRVRCSDLRQASLLGGWVSTVQTAQHRETKWTTLQHPRGSSNIKRIWKASEEHLATKLHTDARLYQQRPANLQVVICSMVTAAYVGILFAPSSSNEIYSTTARQRPPTSPHKRMDRIKERPTGNPSTEISLRKKAHAVSCQTCSQILTVQHYCYGASLKTGCCEAGVNQFDFVFGILSNIKFDSNIIMNTI